VTLIKPGDPGHAQIHREIFAGMFPIAVGYSEEKKKLTKDEKEIIRLTKEIEKLKNVNSPHS
jgi:hypothetical protein